MSEKLSNTEIVLLDKINQLIDENLDNQSFTSDSICKEFGLSRSQLYRLIKESSDLSISLYIRQRKLQKAKDLLINSELKISEITYAVGIDSPQSFSKFFTQQYNISPTEFRKKLPKNSELAPTEEVDDTEQVFIANEGDLPTKPKKRLYLGLAAILLLFAALGGYFWQKNSSKSNLLSDTKTQNIEKSIAILPFKNFGEADNSYFSEGIMEQIHSTLASLIDLRVISTTSTFKYANTQKNIQQIAKELHVNYILVGSVLKLNNQIRLTVELIEAEDDRVLWSKNFEGDTKNIFDYMTIISNEISTVLNQKLNKTEQNKLEKMPTHSLEAFNEFLQGQQLLRSRNYAKMESSIIKFDNAIKLDPNFADAYTHKAVAYFVLGNNQLKNAESFYKISEKNALMAIKLDAENGKAYGVLAQTYAYHNKWEQAVTTFDIAQKFSPNDAEINYWYSLTIRSIGYMNEAIKYSTKAIALDPLAPNIHCGHIINCVYAGKLDLAKKAIKEGEIYFNDAFLYHYAVGFYYVKLKDYKNALVAFERSIKLDTEDLYTQALVTYCKAKMGETSAVNNFIQSLPNLPESQKYFAVATAGLEDKENCLKYLEQAAAINDSPLYIKVSPLFTFLHGEPRFDAILKTLGLTDISVKFE